MLTFKINERTKKLIWVNSVSVLWLTVVCNTHRRLRNSIKGQFTWWKGGSEGGRGRGVNLRDWVSLKHTQKLVLTSLILPPPRTPPSFCDIWFHFSPGHSSSMYRTYGAYSITHMLHFVLRRDRLSQPVASRSICSVSSLISRQLLKWIWCLMSDTMPLDWATVEKQKATRSRPPGGVDRWETASLLLCQEMISRLRGSKLHHLNCIQAGYVVTQPE